MAGAAERAEALGYHVVRVDDAVVGEARVAAPAHVRASLARCSTVSRPACVISSGETTVRVTGSGKGGRNQEFALAAADIIATLDAPAVLGSIGTDGVDGPTDAAGAYVDTDTLAQARAHRLTPSAFLDDNNTYEFFAAIHHLIHTGPTGTNVGDLQLFLLA
jgi:hydroxypyruvate reductase